MCCTVCFGFLDENLVLNRTALNSILTVGLRAFPLIILPSDVQPKVFKALPVHAFTRFLSAVAKAGRDSIAQLSLSVQRHDET